jgi:phage baseplate assembly protein W
MDYGTDFLLEDDDIVFTSDGDIKLVSGPATVAQDIDQALKTTPGSLYWDKEAGSTLLFMLNDSESSAASVIAELERVAIADPRVDPESVKAYQTGTNKFRLEFTPVGAVTTETLEYDLNKNREAQDA